MSLEKYLKMNILKLEEVELLLKNLKETNEKALSNCKVNMNSSEKVIETYQKIQNQNLIVAIILNEIENLKKV